MHRCLAGVIVSSLAFGCGGNSTGGNVGSGGTAGVGGTSGTGGTIPALCAQPQEVGPCDAAFPRFWHNPETRRCEQFVYGGCQGNDNNFETLAECEQACNVAAVDYASCTTASDCELLPAGCCWTCFPASVDDYVSVASRYSFDFRAHQDCPGNVGCPACPAPRQDQDLTGNFGVRCEANQCTVFDVRSSDLAACNVNTDCRLRFGSACCESCSGVIPPLPPAVVAINASIDLIQALCDGRPQPCDACAPSYPANASAVCLDGACTVVWAL